MSPEEIEFENRVVRLKRLMEEVVDLLEVVPEVMLTISSRPMSLAPAAASPVPALPGGEALVVLSGASDWATMEDSTPHPVTVFRALADQVREAMGRPSVPAESMGSASSFLLEHLRWIAARPEGARHVEQQLGRVRRHLQVLVGDAEPPRMPSAEELVQQMLAMVDEEPDRYRMTLVEADVLWPGIHARIRKAKQRGSFDYEPGADGRFPVALLRLFTIDRRTRRAEGVVGATSRA
ncbi:hypothetical protein [Brachybacterium kimchii]|uniref:DUF222 domain-containing protein n=1 Tax=Brachybacterium kimchii TaxID=2942909 RepID=A0ABY4NBG5_9MICO|nr:hypothetical protein [Brachybacterium kimchii]UQN30670.1 hypothetical protein M4486_05035 [Brachybacterium kimchii]